MLIRLDRLLSQAGECSRSEAARLIRGGEVLVDGAPARSGAEKIDPENSVVTLRGRTVRFSNRVCLMMNKPAGVLTATEDRDQKTVLDLLKGPHARMRLFPVGRLDKDTEGLLLLTDDGELAHRVITPKRGVEKVYYAETDGALAREDAIAFAAGLELRDGTRCLPAKLELLETGERSAVLVTVREGKYHQVRRMLASRGAPVTKLKRLSVGGLRLDDSIAPGEYRELSEDEISSIFL